MARKTKYNPELVQRLTSALEAGATQKDACAYAGISHQTFHTWLNTKDEFLEAVTRAEGQARFAATLVIKQALKGVEQVTTTNDVITETRLRKMKDAETKQIVEVPYEYTKRTNGTTITKFPPDWRAAVEYLKRRDPEHWSDKLNIKHEDWRSQAIADIRAGKIPFRMMVELFDRSLAEQLFIQAGVPIE